LPLSYYPDLMKLTLVSTPLFTRDFDSPSSRSNSATQQGSIAQSLNGVREVVGANLTSPTRHELNSSPREDAKEVHGSSPSESAIDPGSTPGARTVGRYVRDIEVGSSILTAPTTWGWTPYGCATISFSGVGNGNNDLGPRRSLVGLRAIMQRPLSAGPRV
jgi:hypothetical protein